MILVQCASDVCLMSGLRGYLNQFLEEEKLIGNKRMDRLSQNLTILIIHLWENLMPLLILFGLGPHSSCLFGSKTSTSEPGRELT